MKKASWLFCLMTVIGLVSCEDDTVTPFDPAAQLEIDKGRIDKYLETHYYNEETDALEDIVEGENKPTLLSQLSDDVEVGKLKKIEVKIGDLTFPLYVYTTQIGTNPKGNKTPGKFDYVDVAYSFTLLDSDNVLEETTEPHRWISLRSTIVGWSEAFPYFNPGSVIRNSSTDDLEYSDPGKGFIIIPSGLGYENASTNFVIPPNSILVYKVELRDVALVDDDNDGVPTKIEIGSEVETIDTDGDGIANFLDDDDDGDGIKTIDEVVSEVTIEDPRGAFLEFSLELTDSDKNGVPDYLE